ncbi:MAG: hypothetical protein HQM09_04560, partial [Candidatus Riflebacteria bacterium]|nr:hypothetical protein [Candidatus Riflebacteria bacterium]
YSKIKLGDKLHLDVKDLNGPLFVENKTQGVRFEVVHPLSPRDIEILKAGGQLAYAKHKATAGK